jgi:ABC-type lipoprotein release transport system permease subunit
MNVKIAWRNIWRNRKRTFITISSVILAVTLSSFMRSFQEGTYAKMIENAVGQFTGYVQVHQKNYWNDKTLDNGIEISDSLINTILTTPGVEGADLRLESFSLAAFQNKSKGAYIMGIVPDTTNDMLNLHTKIVSGKFLKKNDAGVLRGQNLSHFLDISVGATLVLVGQGHWGQSATGAFPVKGIVKMPAPDIDRQLLIMSLTTAQNFFSFPGGITSVVVKFSDPDNTAKITAALNSRLDTAQYTAMTWQKMSPELVQIIESDRIGGIAMLAILYMIIAFGVFGTVLMMTEERKKEFGVMVAIGMQKTRLIAISFYEALFINSIGIATGLFIGFLLVLYFHYFPIVMTGENAQSMEKLGVEPVLPTILSLKIFLFQAFNVLMITVVAAFYPVISIGKLKVIKALRR